MTPRPLAALVLLGAALCCGAAAAFAPWRPLSDKGGLRMERRDVDGSPLPEVRVTAHSPLAVARIAAAIWHERPGTKLYRRYPRQRTILRDDATDRVVYQRITAPVVSERDYTVHLHRNGDGTRGPFLVDFTLDNGAGPPPVPGVVRLTRLSGTWSVTPAADGGSDVVYTFHSEPGGSIPAFLVRGQYVESARELVADVLEWAESHP